MGFNHKHLTYNKQILTYDVRQYGFYGSSAKILTEANIVTLDP